MNEVTEALRLCDGRHSVAQEAGPDCGKQIERAFRLTLGRPPSTEERARAATASIEELAVVLFNLNEFIYVE